MKDGFKPLLLFVGSLDCFFFLTNFAFELLLFIFICSNGGIFLGNQFLQSSVCFLFLRLSSLDCCFFIADSLLQLRLRSFEILLDILDRLILLNYRLLHCLLQLKFFFLDGSGLLKRSLNLGPFFDNFFPCRVPFRSQLFHALIEDHLVSD